MQYEQSLTAIVGNRHAARRGLTLVELLVVVVILGMIASMVLVGLSGTQNNAREAKTRGTIAKLHTLIMEKYDSYMSRRVPISIPPQTQPRQAALLRLNALRDLMRLEMPERHADYLQPTNIFTTLPSVTRAYISRANPSKSHSEFTRFESAECLYMIVAYGLGEADGLSQFGETEIGDFDGDGMKEFLDAWGRPISFLRWAPRFDSAVQFPNRDVENSVRNQQFLDKHHDPYDLLRVDEHAYALYPLIYSGGADQGYDIEVKNVPFQYRDPYFTDNGRGTRNQNGTTNKTLAGDTDPGGVEENWHDNITNHELLNP
ncbi:MAG: prepilin-type N-terminal cleavage/methylation domain-containing protein [Pirellulales bacterium]|nr:prepilin-type N-terminal cleavage/methylation domain-containing protein [Pirellulales bacterium]